MQIFNELRKQIVKKSIQIKDPEKTIHQIDEIVNSVPALSSNLKNLKKELMQLESSINFTSLRHLEDIKAKLQMHEKYCSENTSNTEEAKKSIDEPDSSLKTLKKKIEDNAEYITRGRYSIMLSKDSSFTRCPPLKITY